LFVASAAYSPHNRTHVDAHASLLQLKLGQQVWQLERLHKKVVLVAVNRLHSLPAEKTKPTAANSKTAAVPET
jgi:hypothetical protein